MKGMVLIIVLWTMVLISFIITTMSFQASNSIVQAQLAKEKLEAKSLAQAAVYYASVRLNLNSPDYPISLSGIPLQLNQWGIPIKISLRGLNSFINPNIASDALLIALLEGLIKRDGLKADAQKIAENIIKWREGSSADTDIKRYQFFALEELRLVDSVNEEVYMAMRPYLSLYAQSAQVNVETASLSLLQLLFPNNLKEVETYVREREAAIKNAEPLPPFPITSNLVINQQGSAGFIAEVHVETPSGGIYSASTIVLQDRGNYIRLEGWTEGILEK